MRRPFYGFGQIALAAACCFAGSSALAEIRVCDGGGAAGSGAGKITSVPYTISAPGVYCVTQKITSALTSGAAITITANNVLLDLNDFAIGNIGAGPSTTAIGIEAIDRQNIHIRNGTLRGFWVAIGLLNGTAIGLATANSSGHTVEGILADTSYFAGIAATGPFVSIKNNKVINTQGSNVANPTFPANSAINAAFGILAGPGIGIHVTGNEVYDTDCTNGCTASTASVAGIVIQPTTHGTVVENNIIVNQALSAIAGSQAIHFGGQNGTAASFDGFVYYNTINQWAQGVTFCNNPGFVCTGVMFNNTSASVTSPYNGGTSPSVPVAGTNF